MPVVPAPPVPEMPRMDMLLVPELSKFTPGVKRATSEKSLMPRLSRLSCVSAVTLIGTLLRLSSRRVAVTVISCKGPAALSVLELCSCARPAPGRQASATNDALMSARVTRELLRRISRIWPPHTVFELFRHIDRTALYSQAHTKLKHAGRGSPAACARACRWRHISHCTAPQRRTRCRSPRHPPGSRRWPPDAPRRAAPRTSAATENYRSCSARRVRWQS